MTKRSDSDYYRGEEGEICLPDRRNTDHYNGNNQRSNGYRSNGHRYNRNDHILTGNTQALDQKDRVEYEFQFDDILSLDIHRAKFKKSSGLSELLKRWLCYSTSFEWRILFWQVGFLTALVILWMVGLSLYLSLVDAFIPRENALIGTGIPQPGLSFRPRNTNVLSTLIKFKHGGSGDWQPIKLSLDNFLKAYAFGKTQGSSKPCNWNSTVTKETRCHVANRKWMALDTDVPCTGAEKYGMYHGRPCVALKMNNVYGWEPQPYYNLTEVQYLDDMPLSLKKHIRGIWQKNCKGKGKQLEERCPRMRMVWVSCEGETPADTEHLGKIYYVPWRGFPGFYYPFLNQMDYLSPLVWIQFRNITPGVLIQVRCKLWAKNIQHDSDNPRKGGVHFEILMD